MFKGGVHTLDIALFVVNHHRRSAQVYDACSQGISQFYLHNHTFIRNRNEPLPAFAFPAAAGTHLPTTEEWKAELTLVRSSPG